MRLIHPQTLNVADALALIEVDGLVRGARLVDDLLKAAHVRILASEVYSGPRHLVLFDGEIEALSRSFEAGCAVGSDRLVDTVILPQAHPQLVAALGGAAVASLPEVVMLSLPKTGTTSFHRFMTKVYQIVDDVDGPVVIASLEQPAKMNNTKHVVNETCFFIFNSYTLFADPPTSVNIKPSSNHPRWASLVHGSLEESPQKNQVTIQRHSQSGQPHCQCEVKTPPS